MRLSVFVLSVGIAGAVVACGAHRAAAANDYEEYTCPQPIGAIVRENCAASALQYEGVHFEGQAGFGAANAKADYRAMAIREADAVVAMLKEQRGQLCQNFNTCKLTVVDYQERQRALDDSYIALLALRDASANGINSERILDQIRTLRAGVGPQKSTPRESPSRRNSSQPRDDGADNDDD